MAKRLTLIGFIGLLIVGLSCKKSTESSATLTGKIILSQCGTAVIQIDGASGTGGGVVWANGGVSYSNAATIGNYCYLKGLGIRAGDIVSFKTVVTNPQPNASCIVELCLIAIPQPKSVIYVTDMVKTGP